MSYNCKVRQSVPIDHWPLFTGKMESDNQHIPLVLCVFYQLFGAKKVKMIESNLDPFGYALRIGLFSEKRHMDD